MPGWMHHTNYYNFISLKVYFYPRSSFILKNHEYQYVNISIVFLKILWQRQVAEDILPNLICQHIKSLH